MLKFTHKKEDISTRCRICSSSSDFQKKNTLNIVQNFYLKKVSGVSDDMVPWQTKQSFGRGRVC